MILLNHKRLLLALSILVVGILVAGVMILYRYHRYNVVAQEVHIDDADMMKINWYTVGNPTERPEWKEILGEFRKKQVIAIAFRLDTFLVYPNKTEIYKIATKPHDLDMLIDDLFHAMNTSQNPSQGIRHSINIVFSDRTGIIIGFGCDFKQKVFYGSSWQSPELFRDYAQIFNMSELMYIEEKKENDIRKSKELNNPLRDSK